MNYTLLNAYKNENDFYTRYPLTVIKHLGYNGHIGGQEKAYDMAGVEIRYLSDSTSFNLSLEILGEGFITLFIGDFSIKRILLVDGINEITEPLHERFLNLKPKDYNYPSNLFRIKLETGYKLKNIEIKDINAKPFNSPLKKAVYYGSSFTEGAGSLAIPYSYANISSMLLNVEMLNKGLSGNCLCEKETVDYLNSLNPDFYILEIGCNMRGYMDSQEFSKRVDYLLNTLKDKKVFLISSLEFFVKEFSIFTNPPYHDKNLAFTKIVKDLANKYNIYLIPMTKLMTHFTDVSYDMLHPSQLGHLNIAYNLYNEIRNLI